MRTFVCCVVAAVYRGCRVGVVSHAPGVAVGAAAGAQADGAAMLTDWLTDGGDNQRTGWNKNEKILTKENVKNLKLLWKIETGNQPRALHSLMPVLVVGQLATASGPQQVGIVNGISDNLYALRRRGRQDPLAEALGLRAAGGRGGGGGGRTPPDPRISGSFGRAAAATRR